MPMYKTKRPEIAMNPIRKSIACFHIGLSSLLAYGTAYAQPEVISYELQNQEDYVNLIIYGEKFGKGPSIAFYEDFNSGTPGSSLKSNTPLVGSWDFSAYPPSYITTPDGDIGMRIKDPDSGIMNQFKVRFKKDSEIFIHYSVQIPEGYAWPTITDANDKSFSPMSSWKFTWLLNGDRAFSTDSDLDICIPQHPGSGGLQIAGNSGGLYGPSFKTWWSAHDQNHISFWLTRRKDLAINYADAQWRTSNNLTKTQTTEFSGKPFQKDGVEITFDQINFPGWFRSGPDDKFNAIYDNIYVATGPNSRARIEIIDSDIISNSGNIFVIPVVEWSESKILARVHKKTLEKFKNAHISITDASGKSAAKPIKICLSCPEAPEVKLITP